MSKAITIKADGTTYTLEYNRKSVEIMERQGFVIEQVSEKPMTMLPALFAGAFRMHHPTVKREAIDRLYDRLNNKENLIVKLVELYQEPVATLFEEPDEADEGNVAWSADWE